MHQNPGSTYPDAFVVHLPHLTHTQPRKLSNNCWMRFTAGKSCLITATTMTEQRLMQCKVKNININ